MGGRDKIAPLGAENPRPPSDLPGMAALSPWGRSDLLIDAPKKLMRPEYLPARSSGSEPGTFGWTGS